ncbi:MAG: hypothetical protein NTV08_04500 [Verrucomicrobia bacterium]|nr:hypothetical protein [Verrucomicrobiota bacterium]
MTAQAGDLLVKQIAPRLRALVPKSVKPVEAEDTEELVQDAITFAAQMLHRVEQTGRKFTPDNIAYYAVLHMRSGRRSQSANRTDTMAPGTLGELLASDHEDPPIQSSLPPAYALA